MFAAKQQAINIENSDDTAKLELYRQIGEGYKAMQEGREASLDDVIKKIERRRAERG